MAYPAYGTFQCRDKNLTCPGSLPLWLIQYYIQHAGIMKPVYKIVEYSEQHPQH